jgi:hypothetical protein
MSKQILTIIACIVFMGLPLTVRALDVSPVVRPDFSIPPGALVSDKGTIFLIINGQQIPFASWDAFVGLGYSLSNVKAVDLSTRSFVRTKGVFSRNVGHTWGSWLLYNKTVYYSHQDGMIPVPSWEVFLENGGFATAIVPANKYDIDDLRAKPNLPPLKKWDSRVWLFAPEQAAARDADRVERVEKVKAALGAYHEINASYPSQLKDLTPRFLQSVPGSVLPPDGDCNVSRNAFRYAVTPESYELKFCLGSGQGSYAAGDNTVSP